MINFEDFQGLDELNEFVRLHTGRVINIETVTNTQTVTHGHGGDYSEAIETYEHLRVWYHENEA